MLYSNHIAHAVCRLCTVRAAVTTRAQNHCSPLARGAADTGTLLLRTRPRSISICIPPLPIRYRPETMSMTVIRIIDHKVERLSRDLQTLLVIYDFDQKANIPIRHTPAKIIFDNSHTKRPGRIRRAGVFPLGVRRPLALSR